MQANAATNSTTTTNDDTTDDDNVESLGPTVVLLFMFIGLGIGVILMQILSVMGEVRHNIIFIHSNIEFCFHATSGNTVHLHNILFRTHIFICHIRTR